MTQEAFGELLGVTAVTVGRWERGKDEPNIGIKRRLEVLVSPNVSADFAIKALVQGYGGIAVLADSNWRVINASPLFLALNRFSEIDVFGRDDSKLWPSEMDPFMKLFRPHEPHDGRATHEVACALDLLRLAFAYCLGQTGRRSRNAHCLQEKRQLRVKN